MPPRLLTLLTQIENALVNHGVAAVNHRAQRSVNFHKGVARVVFGDGSGSIVVQNFTLADGQICVRASLAWAGCAEVKQHAIYPGQDFDWAGAADAIAAAWAEGLLAARKAVVSAGALPVPAVSEAVSADAATALRGVGTKEPEAAMG